MHPPITTLDAATPVATFAKPTGPEAKIARVLASLNQFEDWAHHPVPTNLEHDLKQLSQQQLMTAATVCLLRLAKLSEQAGRDQDHGRQTL